MLATVFADARDLSGALGNWAKIKTAFVLDPTDLFPPYHEPVLCESYELGLAESAGTR